MILILISNTLYSQDYSYKSKNYGITIFNYLIKKTKTDSISLEEFMEFSKPFSKWDIRPLKRNKVWAIDTIHSASTIPNFIWGGMAKKYNLTESQASNKPNLFLDQGVNRKKENSQFFNQKKKKLKKLTQKILKSSNKIFLNQKNIQRVDNIYKENNYYWTYKIPKDSPFPISDKTEKLTHRKFSKKQKTILKLLSELNIYTAYKANRGIYFLIDGFTDNSYGFYLSSDGIMETSNNLFQIMTYERLSNNFFYYVAN